LKIELEEKKDFFDAKKRETESLYFIFIFVRDQTRLSNFVSCLSADPQA